LAVERLTAPERETIINTSDADDHLSIWTSQRTVITALRRKTAFKETASGHHGETEWARFEIPVTDVNFGALAKRRGTPRHNLASVPEDSSLTEVA
jgi:hypothetical protein